MSGSGWEDMGAEGKCWRTGGRMAFRKLSAVLAVTQAPVPV